MFQHLDKCQLPALISKYKNKAKRPGNERKNAIVQRKRVSFFHNTLAVKDASQDDLFITQNPECSKLAGVTHNSEKCTAHTTIETKIYTGFGSSHLETPQ